MSRNHPVRGVKGSGKPSLFKGFRKPWRVGEPPIIVKPCRQALNEAIRDENFDAATEIAKKQHLRVYSRASKPALLGLLQGLLRGERIHDVPRSL